MAAASVKPSTGRSTPAPARSGTPDVEPAEQPGRGQREPETEQAAGSGHHETLRHELAHQPTPTASERGPDGEFLPTRNPPRQQEIREVPAHDEHDQHDGPDEEQGRGAEFAAHPAPAEESRPGRSRFDRPAGDGGRSAPLRPAPPRPSRPGRAARSVRAYFRFHHFERRWRTAARSPRCSPARIWSRNGRTRGGPPITTTDRPSI